MRNLSSRKYCLKCSPFGNHNTKKIHKDGNTQDEKLVCELCGKSYNYTPSSGKSKHYCISCLQKRKRIAYSRAITDILGGECEFCGFDGCISALSVHHIGEKKFSLVNACRFSYKKIAEELENSILLCSNCHAEEHCGGKRGYCEEHSWEGNCCSPDNPCDNNCKNLFRRNRRRKMLIERKGPECLKCGYNACLSAICFHHKEEEKKNFSLNSSEFSRTIASLRDEVEKCEVLCSNCHMNIHCNCKLKCQTRFKDREDTVKERIEEHL